MDYTKALLQHKTSFYSPTLPGLGILASVYWMQSQKKDVSSRFTKKHPIEIAIKLGDGLESRVGKLKINMYI